MTDILIVEDEQAILVSLGFILMRCGWSVGVARDGEAALEAAFRFRPRMVLLDIMLPKRGGLDVLKIAAFGSCFQKEILWLVVNTADLSLGAHPALNPARLAISLMTRPSSLTLEASRAERVAPNATRLKPGLCGYPGLVLDRIL